MRYEKPEALLELARLLAASAEGMTLEEMCQITGKSRRTVERMRDSLVSLFPQMIEEADGATKRFRIPGGLDGFYQCPTTEELLELSKIIEEHRSAGAHVRADSLQGLDRKIRAAMRRPSLLRIEPDLEALLQAEFIAIQAGPRPVEDEAVFLTIRSALLESRSLQITYGAGSRPGEPREIVPYGILFGRMNYLIAADFGTEHPKHWRFDRICDLKLLNRHAARPPEFNLKVFANASFGYFQGEQEDVVLHVLPHGNDDDFKNWRFHPDQIVEYLPDGSALVRFRASGMIELAWHLFTWGNRIQVLAPVSLRQLLTTELRVALDHHDAPPRYLAQNPQGGGRA
jgi:predicted DNA-binding transcriptional regulator YafY